PATTETSTLSLHDALPISGDMPGPPIPTPDGRGFQQCDAVPHRSGAQLASCANLGARLQVRRGVAEAAARADGRNAFDETGGREDRKSTRLNSSHRTISYA